MTVFSTASENSDNPSEEENLGDLARFLRLGIGQEWRAELEATEIEVHQHRLRSRTLRDVAEMLLHRGDLVTLQAGDLQMTGEVVGYGSDYLTLTTESLCVDARLDRVSLRIARRTAGGLESRGWAPTWTARLAELEITGEPVEVCGPLFPERRKGRIRVVSADHVWLVGPAGIDYYIPTGQITALIRPLTVAGHPR